MTVVWQPYALICLKPHPTLSVLGSKVDSAIITPLLVNFNPLLSASWYFEKTKVESNFPNYRLFVTFLIPKLNPH